jgi:heme/copper-type cytochrome/quinol oxidase subunit 2
MDYKLITTIVLVAVILFIVVYDLWVYKRTGGDQKTDATISKLLFLAARDRPIIAIVFGLAIGALLGHFWWPQHVFHTCQ